MRKSPLRPENWQAVTSLWQVLGQSGKDLVFRADETVVRRGKDISGAIDGRPVGFQSASRATCTQNRDRITMR